MQPNFSLDQFGRWSGGVAAAAVAATPEELSARFTTAAGALLGSDRVYVGFYRRDITQSLLSTRESEIARHLIDGGNAKTISRNLAISPGTVRNHIKQIYRKLGVHSQVELLASIREVVQD